MILPDRKAYELEGIDNETVWYDRYDFDDGYLADLDVDHGIVKGHISDGNSASDTSTASSPASSTPARSGN